MTIASEIQRIQTAISNAYQACATMGATMPVTQDSDHLQACIASIVVTPPSVGNDFVTISGDNIVTKAGTNLSYDGDNNISDLPTAQSISGSMMSFVDSSQTEKMSLSDFRQTIYKGFPLKQFDRIDNKATVAGFFTDENNQKYAVAVFDHNYRTGRGWLQSGLNSGLPLYATTDDVYGSRLTATSVTQYMLNKFNATQSPAFHYANQAYLTLNRMVYRGVVPNMYELRYLIDANYQTLDELNPGGYGVSLTSILYTAYKDNRGALSCQEKTRGNVYYRKDNGSNTISQWPQWSKYVVPVAEIPVDANNVPLY